MPQIVIAPSSIGTAQFTIAAPETNTNRTITLPDSTTTIVGTDSIQTLTNKTLSAPTIISYRGGVLIQSSTVTASSTSVDFTGIPSWAKRITLGFSNLSTNGTSNMIAQLGISSGVTTSGYLASTGQGGVGAVAFTNGFGLSVSTSAATTIHGLGVFMNMGSNMWVYSMSGAFSNAAAVINGGGLITLSGSLDRLRVTTVAGTDTFDTGTLSVIWEG